MAENVVAAVICFVLGVFVSVLNFFISKKMLVKYTDKYHFVTIIRQIIQVTFLVALYIVGAILKLNPVYTLIGGALGNTISMFFFTKKLLDVNKEITEAKKNG